MAKPLAIFLIGLSLAVGTHCGRKGPLVLPTGRAPMPVTGLTAVSGDGMVLLRWTNPIKAISGRPIGPLDAVEIWVLDPEVPAGGPALSPGEFQKSGRLVRRIPRQDFGIHTEMAGGASRVMVFSYAVRPQTPAPVRLAFAVRVFDRKGRASDFSEPAFITVGREDAKFNRPAVIGIFW